MGDFLNDTIGDWIWPHDLGIADWYIGHDRPLQALAVFEHLYARMRRDEFDPQDRARELRGVLICLFDLCVETGLTGRARYVAELIGDYRADGLIDLSTHTEVVSKESGLRFREVGEFMDEEREKAREGLRGKHGRLLDSLHLATQKLVVDAELWSHPRLMSLEPTAAPRHLTLAIEAEFHYKVIEPRRPSVKSALDKFIGKGKPLKDNHSCSPGQILHLIKESGSNPLARAVLGSIREWWDNGREESEEALSLVAQHRERLFHVSSGGAYSPEDCVEFLHAVHASGWVFRFLQTVQPR